MRRISSIVSVLVMGLTLAPEVQGQGPDWVAKVLPERSFHFGTVARGSKVRHSYRLVNQLDRPLRIVDYKTKCGCTEVRLGAREIPPGTQTTIEAVIDTTKFLGEKQSGLTLIFDQPTYAEVNLDLSCFIKGDVWLSPGLVDFGVISRSSGTKPTATLTLSYTGGQANWGITRMQTRTSQLSAKLQEQDRSAGGTVQYVLAATLDPSSLNGFFKDEITLHTNDPASPTIPVSVVGTVQAMVTVSPSPLVVGQVKPGQIVTKSLLVRSSKPFQVKAVNPSAEELSADPVPAGAKPVHTLRVTFKAPRQPGPFTAVFSIETDLPEEPPAELRLFATVVP